jgi:hypothetical protein
MLFQFSKRDITHVYPQLTCLCCKWHVILEKLICDASGALFG